MPLRDDLEKIQLQATLALNGAHDYYVDTRNAWRAVRRAIQVEGLTLSWRNRFTNSAVNQQELLPRAERYVKVELTCATLQQFVSIFENFLSDAVRAWLLAYPERLSNRQLTGKEMLNLPDKAAIIDALVDKEIRDIFYDRPANWFEYVRGLVHIQSPTQVEAEKYAEIKATRDVFVHGQGLANAYYIAKSGRAARAALGQPLAITQPYHQQSWDLISKLVRDIGTDMATKA